MHKTHKSGERNGGSVYLGSCSGFCVYLQESESLQSDKRLEKKKKTASELKYVWRYGIWTQKKRLGLAD